MHPAYSVIFFTTSSGAGYGLLFWLSLLHAAGGAPDGRWSLLAILVMALVLITLGLLASTLHLGHPERAIGALSQWRSSWLSREGLAALATYVPAGLLALVWLFGIGTAWSVPLALLSAAGAVATVYCTGMIYASLPTIREWNMPMVPAIYLVLTAASGALILATLLALFGAASGWVALLTIATLMAAAALKWLYWARIDANPGKYTDEMAIGIPGASAIRQLDPPHTRPNYVMREMGYLVGRKHARRLRRIALASLCGLPLLLVLLALLWHAAAPFLLIVATLSAAVGLLIERWLFFAEASHVSMLYYGRKRA
ncbi:DmsC/YnfH family molybdoenzyme membrane anchor subunit [Tropicimonas sp. IMCC34043]|uniref:dimethyl sulfoxide reductase anchor subunit family protein n=1 Tax=Tropicimonas sp. IMCC34043 TaxID=2248760 RepID=UPI000E273388|nr:DmsC/YnfH family molybdoenzyme membrane anchor subunit [Tropicimonas sp. IMCC34043]